MKSIYIKFLWFEIQNSSFTVDEVSNKIVEWFFGLQRISLNSLFSPWGQPLNSVKAVNAFPIEIQTVGVESATGVSQTLMQKQIPSGFC